MTKNLTPLQEKLIESLINEFTKINPKPSVEGSRFSLKSIADCNNEEKRFMDTIAKHNETMMKVFINQFNNEVKAFKKEFGKALELQMGYFLHGTLLKSYDNWVTENKDRPIYDNNSYNEMRLYLVSKTKVYQGDYNYCKGKKYIELYVDFKRERISHKLETDKVITLPKIIGLQYSTHDYIRRDRGVTTSTLDEMIQTNKDIQRKIVELIN